MRRVLLIDRSHHNAAMLQAALRQRRFDVYIEGQKCRAVEMLCRVVPQWEFVVVVARNASKEELVLLRDLVMASQQFNQTGLPQFLFATCMSCASWLRIQVERMGVHYIRL